MQIDKLINAINKLKKDSKPKWGRMNSSQMLWHCNKFVIFYLNEKKYSEEMLMNWCLINFGYHGRLNISHWTKRDRIELRYFMFERW